MEQPEYAGAREAAGAGVEEPKYAKTDNEEDDFGLGLVPTNTPGVFINPAGVMVDRHGCIMSMQRVKEADQARFEAVLGGPVDTPAKLLTAVALDPRLPLATRIDAAKSAAPYTDRKKPMGIDGGEDGKPIMLSIRELRGLSDGELDQMEQLLLKGIAAASAEEAEK